jgi:hypothetical protein
MLENIFVIIIVVVLETGFLLLRRKIDKES